MRQKPISIITISHEAFGDGRAVAERVAAILGYRCISKEVLAKASQRYGITEAKLFEVLEEKPHHTGGRNGLRAAGFIAPRSRRPCASSRRTEILFTTGAQDRNFSPAFAAC